MTQSLGREQSRMLAELADQLIPPAPGAISASEAGIPGPLLDKIEQYAPERLDLLRLVVEAAAKTDPATALEKLKVDDRITYDSFCETIAAAYFMSAEVRRKVGFPGREPVPAKIDAVDLEELLVPVLEGGFGPRPV
ncbi:MAG: hypothetical protein KDJ87_05250 [Rhizobiaceae bacterium]|nr:hypothetical protein [Rhizobiaceae bacterium]